MSLFLFADTTPNVGDEKWELENILFIFFIFLVLLLITTKF